MSMATAVSDDVFSSTWWLRVWGGSALCAEQRAVGERARTRNLMLRVAYIVA